MTNNICMGLHTQSQNISNCEKNLSDEKILEVYMTKITLNWEWTNEYIDIAIKDVPNNGYLPIFPSKMWGNSTMTIINWQNGLKTTYWRWPHFNSHC